MQKRVLTVDDSKTMRDMLLVTLKQAGYDVVQAEDGQDALSKLESGGADVIITDINMPVMDGIAFIKACRAMGIVMTNTCINYQTVMPPVRGDHVAYGDTGVVIYSNSFCGARSNFEGGP